jgi:hypothetical protein
MNGEGENNPGAAIASAILIIIAIVILSLVASAAKLATKPERTRNPCPGHALLVLRWPISPQRPYVGGARCLIASIINWTAIVWS